MKGAKFDVFDFEENDRGEQWSAQKKGDRIVLVKRKFLSPVWLYVFYFLLVGGMFFWLAPDVGNAVLMKAKEVITRGIN